MSCFGFELPGIIVWLNDLTAEDPDPNAVIETEPQLLQTLFGAVLVHNVAPSVVITVCLATFPVAASPGVWSKLPIAVNPGTPNTVIAVAPLQAFQAPAPLFQSRVYIVVPSALITVCRAVPSKANDWSNARTLFRPDMPILLTQPELQLLQLEFQYLEYRILPSEDNTVCLG